MSNYAWGADYHAVMTPRLETLAAWLREQSGQEVASRVYVDTGAILERDHAQGAGLGFIGKNTLLIHPRRGSYLFLGEMLTTLPFDAYDAPGRETLCGTCARCLVRLPDGGLPTALRPRRAALHQLPDHRAERGHSRRAAPAAG
ncbi:MAG: DUF1730 domain-containing protein [Anaerolineae bacterium]|nr:DUF1730 domain-containing protein [Anaerolineae bacterium]